MPIRGNTRNVARRRIIALGVATVAALSGCAATPSATETSAPPTGDFVAAATRAVEEHYSEDTFIPPPTDGPAAQTGKNVWFLSCGSQNTNCNVTSAAFEEAGEKLGWKVTVFDTKNDPTVAADGIRAAIADGADGIAGHSQDCSGRSGALQAAKAAGIKVVMMLSGDCEAADAGENQFDSELKFGGYDTERDWTVAWGAMKAQYFISKTNGQAKFIDISLVDQLPVVEIDDGFLDGIEDCSTCEVVQRVEITVPDIPDGVVAKLQQALIAHPEANAIHVPFDALMTFGIIPVIQRSGLQLIVGGGEGTDVNADFIRQDQQTFSLAFPFEWMSWATADTLNRVFADEPTVQEGGGFVFVDKDNNLPESGAWEPSYDFKSAYESFWSK